MFPTINLTKSNYVCMHVLEAVVPETISTSPSYYSNDGIDILKKRNVFSSTAISSETTVVQSKDDMHTTA